MISMHIGFFLTRLEFSLGPADAFMFHDLLLLLAACTFSVKALSFPNIFECIGEDWY